MIATRSSPSHLSRAVSRGLSGAFLLAALLSTSSALAGPRDDMRSAYTTALGQFNELEFDAATATINTAIAAAESGGSASDPVLASLYVVQAALVYSTEGDAGSARIVESLKKAASLNYHVVVPLEMRSEGMSKYLQQARTAVGAAPSEPVMHTTPAAACGEDLHFEALLGVPDGGLAALYWRPAGSGEYRAAEMPVFSNVGEAVVSAADHGDGDIEYFIFAFDAQNQPVANKGTQEAPIALAQDCKAVAPVDTAPTTEPEPKPKEPSSLPRVWINVGLGTGFGVAKGEAEHTWLQFDPAAPETVYGDAHAGCAIGRWAAAGQPVSDYGGPAIGDAWQNPDYGMPDRFDEMAASWDQDTCETRHGVSGGFAMAPFHIAPEVSFRLGKRISLGVFSRLQLVTATNLKDPDPNKSLASSYQEDVRSADPEGVEVKPDFTWAVGAKFKFFLGKETKKFRPFVGAFAGYGQTRLRVDLGIKNDENGNSVPDDQEIAFDGEPGSADCYPVWPYLDGCTEGSDDQLLAQAVRENSSGDDNRVDTVVIGPGFVGALAGFNFQIAKHFAIFGELQLGGWFPSAGSFLIDLNVGPALTF